MGQRHRSYLDNVENEFNKDNTMKNEINLKDLSLVEMLQLQNSLTKAINTKQPKSCIWDEIKQVKLLENDIYAMEIIKRDFIKKSTVLSKLEDAGYIYCEQYDFISIFVNSNRKPKKNDTFYGFSLHKEGNIMTKTRDDVTDEDFEIVSSILRIKNLSKA